MIIEIVNNKDLVGRRGLVYDIGESESGRHWFFLFWGDVVGCLRVCERKGERK